MAMKTICVSEEIHERLSHLGLKSETYNDIIERLIDVYEKTYFEEFTDDEAEYYNQRIKHFEMGNYEGTRKVDLDVIKAKRQK